VSADAHAARYIIKEKLASGGMGVVYRVFDQVTGEERALKRVTPEASGQRMLLEAFEREYQVLRTLDHPRIIRVFDYGFDDVGPYYTMELLDGQDMRRAAPVPFREACLCLRDVAASLALLHARRLVHRDLSPGNVRMTPDGRCKLLDFGALARFGKCDVIVGTPSGVPPEALSQLPLDHRADLYALGALAYWVLTGRHAYPAKRLADLPLLWLNPPAAPSTVIPGIPKELDELVSSLLSVDARVRPTSAAEVIARLTMVGGLLPEDATDARTALSFISSPRLVGRDESLRKVRELVDAGVKGRGGALSVEAVPGMGRSRFLEETAIHAELAGATVVRVDASTCSKDNGTARALAARLLDALPGTARDRAQPFRSALSALGDELVARLGPGAKTSRTPPRPDRERESLEAWVRAISLETPLVVEVDNVEYADDASLGLIAALAQSAPELPLVVVFTLCLSGDGKSPVGISALLNRSDRLELPGLTAADVRELGGSIFGDAPHVERFSDWLYERTAGSPLHALEIVRQLLSRDVVRYVGGAWMLPARVQDVELAPALGDALSIRIASLSAPARVLSECLSLQREQPTFELCRLLVDDDDDKAVLLLLDELSRQGVLAPDLNGYRFTSVALREATRRGIDAVERQRHHRRLGDVFVHMAARAEDGNPALRLQAGWHLIQGGEERRGADTIASVTHQALTGSLIANLHRVGEPLEAALKVYDRDHRSIYERMPLLAALAQCGYYEELAWGERYGAQALYVLEDLSGLRTARALRRFLGRWLSLIVGIVFAFLRFRVAPLGERKYSFDKILIQLFTAATTQTGAAALCLDAERAARVAAVLEPFAILPKRLTPVGIHQFCRALEHIAREDEALAYDAFGDLITRFSDLRNYPTLPAEGRKLYLAGAQFARGSMAIFRADGKGALESADALDRAGMKLYSMIASQLRWLYYVLRGEFAKAAPHRAELELHAAHVGSVWQVETWQAASLMLIYPLLGDIVSTTRIANRLDVLSRTIPSQRCYAESAKANLATLRGEVTDRTALLRAFAAHTSKAPRSYTGWTGMVGQMARGLNDLGEHALAKELCEKAVSHMTDADREYVSIFLTVEIALSIADAGLGDPQRGLSRLDGLLERFRDRQHPVALGLLHETRARIARSAGLTEQYKASAAEAIRWFESTETPELIARGKRLYDPRSDSALPPAPTGDEVQVPRTVDEEQHMTMRAEEIIVAND
jgi:hypothetical protein